MRTFVAATVAAFMLATSAFAATDLGAPLPSGKPAGVTKAQDQTTTIAYVLAGGIVITGIVLVAANGNSNSTLITGATTATTTTR